MKIHVHFLVIICLGYSSSFVEESLDTCEISFTEEPTGDLFNEMETLHWIKLEKITSRDFTFKYSGYDMSIEEAIALVKDKFKNQIQSFDRVKEYSVLKKVLYKNPGGINTEEILDSYYGMGVEKAWRRGFSGLNVIIAITDVGVNIDITDLKKNIFSNPDQGLARVPANCEGLLVACSHACSNQPTSVMFRSGDFGGRSCWNSSKLSYSGMEKYSPSFHENYVISTRQYDMLTFVWSKDEHNPFTNNQFLSENNKDLSYNYIKGETDVTPEYFHDYADLPYPDHGNRCASLIAAEKGNGICSTGIAYNATIAVVKIFEILQTDKSGSFKTRSNSTVMAKSLLHKIGIVDIYSNSWAFETLFARMTGLLRSALKKCAKEGRHGLGALLVFPAGPEINELMNSEYTITVGAVGKNRTIPTDHIITSAVLTSGLHDGNNLTAQNMVTATINDRCSTQFAGVSAATAQVAGMIALALQANPNLTREDVEDLLVYSSDYIIPNDDKSNGIENAAGLKFHPVFGPGILNASRLVTNAIDRTFHVQTVKHILKASNLGSDIRTAVFCHDCGINGTENSTCVAVIKKAKIEVVYISSADLLTMTLKSPSGTTSVLQDLSTEKINTKGGKRRQILTSVHFWDEVDHGLWVFKLQSNGQNDVIVNISLTLIGIAQQGSNSSIPNSNTEKCGDNYNNATTENPDITYSNKNMAYTVIISSVVPVIVFILFILAIIYNYKRIHKGKHKDDGESSIALTETP